MRGRLEWRQRAALHAQRATLHWPRWLKGADGPTAGGRHLAHPAACARPRPAATVSATTAGSGALHDLTVAAGRAGAQRVNLEGP